MPRFEWPWLLAALPVLLLFARRPATRAVRVNIAGLPVRRTLRLRLRSLPSALRWGALVVLVVALAGPQWGALRVREITKSIGIQVLVDRSGSMSARDMTYRGHPRSRLDVVRQVAEEFIFR